MAKHKGDMLEALRATLRAEREERAQAASLAAGESRTPVPGGSGGPGSTPRETPGAAQDSPRARTAAAGAAAAPVDGGPAARPTPGAGLAGGSPGDGLTDELAELDRQLATARPNRPGVGLLLLQLIALGTAFGLGRLSASRPVEAREDRSVLQPNPMEAPSGGAGSSELARGGSEPGVTPRGAATQPAPSAPGDTRTADDRTFQDPANTHTVQAITYDYNDRNRELAWEVYDHLRALGLPAVQPYRHRSQLVIFVGAAPNAAELDDVLADLRQAPGLNGRGRPFETARVLPLASFR